MLVTVRDTSIPFFIFRFAEFVEGKSHLSDNEVLDYETATLIPRESETWTGIFVFKLN